MPASRSMIDKVPYKAVVETLPVQLAAGEGPDIARVTDLGGLNKFYLDLTPALGARAKYWEDNFGPSLKWLRGGPGDKGIYGMMSQLTVTGAFVNKSLFEQAKVPMPRPHGDMGRLDGSRAQGRGGHQDAVRDGDGPQRSSLRAARGGDGREDLRRQRQSRRSTTATRRRPPSSSTGTRPATCRRKSGAASAARSIAMRSRSSRTAAS